MYRPWERLVLQGCVVDGAELCLSTGDALARSLGADAHDRGYLVVAETLLYMQQKTGCSVARQLGERKMDHLPVDHAGIRCIRRDGAAVLQIVQPLPLYAAAAAAGLHGQIGGDPIE